MCHFCFTQLMAFLHCRLSPLTKSLHSLSVIENNPSTFSDNVKLWIKCFKWWWLFKLFKEWWFILLLPLNQKHRHICCEYFCSGPRNLPASIRVIIFLLRHQQVEQFGHWRCWQKYPSNHSTSDQITNMSFSGCSIQNCGQPLTPTPRFMGYIKASAFNILWILHSVWRFL